MEKPLVSIITPAYNAEKFIIQTIKSVLNQTYENWEMIIIDDCSKDLTYEKIKKYSEKDRRIKLLQNVNNKGVAFTRNKAIDIANGKYIAFLDADDLWDNQKLEKQVKFMETNKVLLSYTGYRKINEDGKIRGSIKVPLKLNYNELLKNCLIGFLTSMYNQEVIGKQYFKNIKAEDYIYWLEMIKKVKIAEGLQEDLASYRVLKSSRSSNKLDIIKHHWRIYYNIEKLGIVSSIKYYFIYIYRGIKRYKI